MTVPTIQRNWQFSADNLITDTSSPNYARRLIFNIVNDMIGNGNWTNSSGNSISPTGNWTVSGSSDSLSSGMDGLNRWIDFNNVIFDSGNHSWIVLRQTGLGSGFPEVCIDIDNTSLDDISILVSPSVGFGIANGGTDGSISARPTATDEIVIISDGNSGCAQFGTRQRYVIMKTDDGSSTRVLIIRNRRLCGWWEFTTVQDAPAAWTEPWVSTLFGVITENPIVNQITIIDFTSNISFGRHSGTNYNMSYTIPSRRTNPGSLDSLIPENPRPNTFSRQWNIIPVGIGCDQVGLRGKHGYIPDLWWRTDVVVEGATLPPNSGNNTHICLGAFILPWNGTTFNLYA